jgi:V/A-type H+-transporting ATPase subunit I
MLGGPAMKRALILVPRGDLDTVIEAVASLGVLHLLDLSGREEWSWAVRPHDVGEAVRARRDTLRSLEALVRFFAPPPTRTPADAALPPVAAVESRVAGWMVEMERLRGERQRLASTIEHLEHYRESAAALAPAGISPARLRAMQRLAPACGWMALGDVPRLEEVLARIPHRLVVAGSRGAQRLVLAFVLPRDREALERALKSTGWVAADLPEQDELLDEGAVERHLAEARAALKALEDEAARSRTALAEPLALARAAIERDLLLLEAQSFTSRSESVVFVSGWIPADRVHALRSAVERVTRGRCHVEIEDPQSIDTVRSGAEPVPILFRNPALVRPFERLTAAYGAPRWREIDPTPIVAVAFWIMFGVMFGDVGHGLVLGAAGWWIFRRLPRYRDYGVILMECGLASAAFGVAFGSVFGFENLLPALWFHPIEDVPRLLRVGTAFGLVFLSLSFALGLVNALRRRDWSGAVFGAHGLLAALAYWIAAALGLRWLATGRAGVDAGLVAVLLGTPLALLWIARVAAALRARRSEGGGAGAGAVGALLEGAVELVDVVVRGVANTVSFVRLAAFAVSHAGLLLAVFALEQTVSQSRFGTLWGVLVVVTGNVIIIALEGLIVSIQSVRLVYYEFFSRFHEGSGLEYRPLRLRTAIGEEMS